MVDERKALLAEWLNAQNLLTEEKLSVASADASFRRYFRLQNKETSYIAMDAPPGLEDFTFVEIGKWMKNSGINVPEIIAKDLDLGFLVLSDFGDFHFQDAICDNDKDMVYSLASKQIIHMQTRLLGSQNRLPLFDKSWQTKELDIFQNGVSRISVDEYQSSRTSSLRLMLSPRPSCIVISTVEIFLFTMRVKLGSSTSRELCTDQLPTILSLLRDCYVDNDPEWIDQW